MALTKQDIKNLLLQDQTPSITQLEEFIDLLFPLVNGTTGKWQKLATLTFNSWKPNGTSLGTVNVRTTATVKLIPKFGVVQAIYVNPTIAFAGAAVVTATLTIADEAGNVFINLYNVFQAPGAEVGAYFNGNAFQFVPDKTAASDLTATLTLNAPAGVIDNLTQGSVDIYGIIETVNPS